MIAVPTTQMDSSFETVRYDDDFVWRDRAQCRGLDNATFFPLSDDPAATMPAKRICAVCPVQSECLSFALETGQPSGVWGGLAPTERRRLLLRLYKQGWSRSRLPTPSQLRKLQQDTWEPEAS